MLQMLLFDATMRATERPIDQMSRASTSIPSRNPIRVFMSQSGPSSCPAHVTGSLRSDLYRAQIHNLKPGTWFGTCGFVGGDGWPESLRDPKGTFNSVDDSSLQASRMLHVDNKIDN